MELANDSGNRAEVIRAARHQTIADEFCGKLTMLPNGGVMAQGFTHNVGHFHTQFEETYFVFAGSLRLALHDPRQAEITEIVVEKFDALRIPPGIGHKVIGGTSDNCIMVSCRPSFVPGDETVARELEDRYQRAEVSLANVCGPARKNP
jgi:oxalate decarboxylase/phosphoglucose isomerase-like protein (cupin superfamily)